MTEKLKKRWMMVCAVWVLALALLFFNNFQLNQIIVNRKKAEVLQKDQIFWKQNVENINKVLKKWGAAFQYVESLRLGLLSMENRLTSLADQNGLSGVKINSHPDQGADSKVPSDISFEGPLPGVMAWLSVLEQDYPFLALRQVRLKMDPSETKTEFNASFYYRYKSVGLEEKYY